MSPHCPGPVFGFHRRVADRSRQELKAAGAGRALCSLIYLGRGTASPALSMDPFGSPGFVVKAGARRQVVPAGDADMELVFDFDGAGRAVFGCLLDAVLSPVGNDIYFDLGHVAVDFEDVRATADTQLAAGAEFFVDRCFHSDLHSRPAGTGLPAQFVRFKR